LWTPGLKQALMMAINREVFVGGRGLDEPYRNEDYPNLSYHNSPVKKWFSGFWGEEIIFYDGHDHPNVLKGFYRYQGMSLI